jgi:hypothetical protein
MVVFFDLGSRREETLPLGIAVAFAERMLWGSEQLDTL